MSYKPAVHVVSDALVQFGVVSLKRLDTANHIVKALRDAGWLREYVNANDLLSSMTHQRDNLLVEVARLTRERDEARESLANWQRDYAACEHDLQQARANAASPEMLAVVKAAKYYRHHGWKDASAWPALCSAAAALAAVERKVEPEPRYEVEHFHDAWFVWDRQPGWKGSSRVAAFYCADAEERAEAECARLNAAERGK